jgi:hypothetical protein
VQFNILRARKQKRPTALANKKNGAIFVQSTIHQCVSKCGVQRKKNLIIMQKYLFWLGKMGKHFVAGRQKMAHCIVQLKK